MRLALGDVGLPLLVLLTWLLLRGIDTRAPAYAASLHRDILQARAGLLRNYDSMGKTLDAMEKAVVGLRSHAQAEGLDPEPADCLAAIVAQQENLTERFKSSNALLQNLQFALLPRSAEHRSDIRCPKCRARGRSRGIGGGDPASDARHRIGIRPAGATAHRPVCGVGPASRA